MILLIIFYAWYFLNCGSLTKVLTEKSEEHKPWQRNHRTGSARSEGFYKISRKDKLTYLKNTKLDTELLSTSAQVMKRGNCDDLSAQLLFILPFSFKFLTCYVYVCRECPSQHSSLHHCCVLDRTSGLNSAVCCPLLAATVTWSSSTSSRWERQYCQSPTNIIGLSKKYICMCWYDDIIFFFGGIENMAEKEYWGI